MKIELLKDFGFSKDKIHPKYYKEGDVLKTPGDIGTEYAGYLVRVGIAKLVKAAPKAPPENPPKEPKRDASLQADKSLKGAPEDKGK